MSTPEQIAAWHRDGKPSFPSYGMAGGTKMEADAQARWIAKYGRDPIGRQTKEEGS